MGVLIMNQFYVSIIFLGIILILVSLVAIAFDRKKFNNLSKQLDRKREELISIIADAEQMVEELNKFSDYMITQMNLKNEELSGNLKLVEEKLAQLDTKAHEACGTTACPEVKAVNSASALPSSVLRQLSFEGKSDWVIDSLGSVSGPAPFGKDENKEKIVPMNTKHKKVLQLADKGLTHTEIARALSMGKGEIQLILELNK